MSQFHNIIHLKYNSIRSTQTAITHNSYIVSQQEKNSATTPRHAEKNKIVEK